MIYKTHKDIYRNVSGRLNLDEDIIQTIGDFYWSDLAARVDKFDKREIYVHNLGCFRLRKRKCDRYMEAIPNIILMMKGHKRSEEAIQAFIDKANWKKGRMQELLAEFAWIREQKLKYEEKKDAYRRNLQEQKQDMGGVKE